MADNWHVGWLREGVAKWNKRRKKVAFVPDLSGLRFFDLLPPDFRESPKTSRYFEKIDLSNANLVEADLSGLNFSRAKFRGANLQYADLSKTNFKSADFSQANLKQCSFDGSYLNDSLFDKSNINGTSFIHADGYRAVFIGIDLEPKKRAVITSIGARIFSSRTEYMRKKETYYPKASGSIIHENSKKVNYKNRYDVLFATNRDIIYERGAVVNFGSKNNGKLEFGICEVIVPDGHRIGSLGSPMWRRWLSGSDDRLRIDNTIYLNRELFWKYISSVESRMKVRERPTIFVHGYNTSFREAIIRAAQIGYDLGIGQGVGLFSWPSAGTAFGYSADEASCEASKYFLADFVEQFAFASTEGSLNIIAHSMGCRCVLGALEVLSNGRKSVLKQINQIILAAADVDVAIMPNLAKHAVGNCARTTSYASESDTALKISGWLHNFPRVGIIPPPFVFKGMDTIAVNDSDLGDLSHGYFSTSRTVIADMYSVLRHNLPPRDRHSIESVRQDGLDFWRLKN